MWLDIIFQPSISNNYRGFALYLSVAPCKCRNTQIISRFCQKRAQRAFSEPMIRLKNFWSILMSVKTMDIIWALIKDNVLGIPTDTCIQCTPLCISVHPKRKIFDRTGIYILEVSRSIFICDFHYDCFVPNNRLCRCQILKFCKVMNKVSIVKNSVVYCIKICFFLSSKKIKKKSTNHRKHFTTHFSF